MNRYIVTSLLLCLLLGWTADGAVYFDDYHNDAHPGKCTINEFLKETAILAPGEKRQLDDECAIFTCQNEFGYATLFTCSARAPLPGCKWGEYIDVKKPYPRCCDRYPICGEEPTTTSKPLEEFGSTELPEQTSEDLTTIGTIFEREEPTKKVSYQEVVSNDLSGDVRNEPTITNEDAILLGI